MATKSDLDVEVQATTEWPLDEKVPPPAKEAPLVLNEQTSQSHMHPDIGGFC